MKIFERNVSSLRLMLFSVEFLLFLGVLYAVHLGRFLILEGWDSYWLFNGRQYLGKSLFFVLVCQASMYLNELYDYRLSWGRRETMIRLLQSLGVACVALGLLYWVFKELAVGAYAFLIGLPLFILLIFRLWDPYLRLTRLPAFLQRVVVLGHSEVVDQIIQRVAEERDSGYRIIGLFSEDQPAPVVAGGRLEPSRVFPMSEFTDRIRAMEVERIVVAIRDRRGTLPFQDLVNLRFRGIQVEEISSFYETLYGKIFIGDLRPSWLIFSEGFRKSSLTLRVKRLLDLVLATVLLVLSFPVLLLVAVLIKLDSRGPVVYRQDRVGEGWKDYTVFKFRSMVQDAEAQGVKWAEEDDPRVTRVGKFLRKYRIDEIPQVVNIIKGDMSFVGPRPERRYFVEQLAREIPYYTQRLMVKPGLSGWAQIKYHYGASRDDTMEKLQYDLYYIKHMSFLLDLSIVFDTIRVIVSGKGAR